MADDAFAWVEIDGASGLTWRSWHTWIELIAFFPSFDRWRRSALLKFQNTAIKADINSGLLFLRVAFPFLRTFNKLIFYMDQPDTIPIPITYPYHQFGRNKTSQSSSSSAPASLWLSRSFADIKRNNRVNVSVCFSNETSVCGQDLVVFGNFIFIIWNHFYWNFNKIVSIFFL